MLGKLAPSAPDPSLPVQRMMILPKVSAHFPMATVPAQNHAALPSPAPLVQSTANSTAQAAHQAPQSPEADATPVEDPSVPVPVPVLQKAPVPVQEAPARHGHVAPKVVPDHPESDAAFRARIGDDSNSISVWERPGEAPEETGVRSAAGPGSPGSRSEPGPNPVPGPPSRRPGHCIREKARRRSRQ